MNIEEKLLGIENLLLSQKKTLNISEFCLYTGFSKSFAYKLTSKRKIPFSCPNGKLIFFEREAVDEFLLSNPISLSEDVEQDAINYIALKPWKGGKI
jgi:excisionase family DNA binding protein